MWVDIDVLNEEIIRITAFIAGSLFDIQITIIAGSLFDVSKSNSR